MSSQTRPVAPGARLPILVVAGAALLVGLAVPIALGRAVPPVVALAGLGLVLAHLARGWRRDRDALLALGALLVFAVVVGVQSDPALGAAFAAALPAGWCAREERERRPGQGTSSEQWTGWRAWLAWVVVAAVLVVVVTHTAVTVDSGQDLVESFGPATAVAAAGVVVSVVLLLRRLRQRRGSGG